MKGTTPHGPRTPGERERSLRVGVREGGARGREEGGSHHVRQEAGSKRRARAVARASARCTRIRIRSLACSRSARRCRERELGRQRL